MDVIEWINDKSYQRIVDEIRGIVSEDLKKGPKVRRTYDADHSLSDLVFLEGVYNWEPRYYSSDPAYPAPTGDQKFRENRYSILLGEVVRIVKKAAGPNDDVNDIVARIMEAVVNWEDWAYDGLPADDEDASYSGDLAPEVSSIYAGPDQYGQGADDYGDSFSL